VELFVIYWVTACLLAVVLWGFLRRLSPGLRAAAPALVLGTAAYPYAQVSARTLSTTPEE
jgi:hypothetical protein